MAYPTEVNAVVVAPAGNLGTSSPTHRQLHDQYRTALLSIAAKIDALNGETYQDHGAAGTTETLSYATARTHRILLDSASCALTLTGWPASGTKGSLELIVDHGTTTTARTVTYPAGSKFPNGLQPSLPTTEASAIWRYVVTTVDAGTTMFWDYIGGSYA